MPDALSPAPAAPLDPPVPLPDDWPSTVRIVPWVDPLVDRMGYDARSPYVETFWLGVLGPSTVLLLRRVAVWLQAAPDGFDMDLALTAAMLGLGGRSTRNGPFHRALDRTILFGMAQRAGGVLAVRRYLPPLARRHLLRLPGAVQTEHERWVNEHRKRNAEDLRTRARQLALSLVRMGEERTAVEQQLARWRIHPAAIHDAVAWAATQVPPAAASDR